jgi:DNA (cytosine-5)-methyltransferase 1
MRGLIIDNFAGGGGASTGIVAGMGRPVDIAVNHDAAAIAVHTANHPETEHFCQSVWDILPVYVVGNREVDLAWFSPDCKHFSKAKGGKPVEKRIRDLAWVVVAWARDLPPAQRPKVIMLENVEEFQDWGPLVDTPNGPMPCQARKGEEFKRWIRALKKAGYSRIQWRELRACDYGAPTIRKRLFLIARCDGKPIVWPKPTHGHPDTPAVRAGRLKPWRTAAECIDWSIPCPSIFERDRPLKDATCRRIAAGIMRYVVNAKRPFIVPITHTTNGDQAHDSADPLRTITTAKGGEFALVNPSIVPLTHHGGDGRVYDSADPMVTVTGAHRGELAVMAAHVTKFRNNSIGSGADEPMHTVTANSFIKRGGGAAPLGLVTATMVQTGYGEREGQAPRALDVEKPLGTVVAGAAKHAVVEAALAPLIDSQYGNSEGYDAAKPVPTVTAGGAGKQALVTAFLAQHNGGFYDGAGRAAEEPVSTVTQSGAQQQVVAATLVGCGGRAAQSRPRGLKEPTATSTAKADVCLATSHLVKLRGTCADGQPVDEPMPTATAGGTHIGEVRAFLCKYYSAADNGQTLDDPLHTVTTKERFGLVTVTIEGEEYVIVDIGMRMLTPRELARAQGFPDSYILDPVCTYTTDSGAQKTGPLPKTHQIAKIGNSVCPVMAEVLTRANCWMYGSDAEERFAAQ